MQFHIFIKFGNFLNYYKVSHFGYFIFFCTLRACCIFKFFYKNCIKICNLTVIITSDFKSIQS